MSLARRKKAAGDTAGKPVSEIKLSDTVRRRVASELGIPAGVAAVPDAIHVVRVRRQNLRTRPGSPLVWILDIP